MLKRFLAALAVLCLLSACASHTAHRAGKATQRPYTVGGKTYHPLAHGEGFQEEGLASWYEPGWFSGKTTANGERLHSGDLTCAHKILPMNTEVTVRNMENGREVKVRVNDRGPFVAGRCIDLTPAGAKALGFYGKGSAHVQVATEGAVPGMQGGRLPGPFYVQVGAFAVPGNAGKLLERMRRLGYVQSRLQEGDQGGVHLWRVQAGTFSTVETAQSVLEHLTGDFPDAFVIAQ